MEKPLLNVTIKEILKDTRSLCQIANIVLDRQNLSFTKITNQELKPKIRKFNSKDLVFNHVKKEFENYIEITHKKRNHFNYNWKIYLEENDFCGLSIKHLTNVNYTWVSNQQRLSNFIRSKKWVNADKIDDRIRAENRIIESAERRRKILNSFCPH